ncbi:pilus assembly protein TadG-related protein [Peristeroidobacter soli]|uniref:pilus assembly protein TadG-related protein n=1 Tax=Peristeroidobacter soli TaxID=2497877 RepID=UPI0013005557|nr:pilus assembly protein TadG-related protein [Peristeroidobacter soli]
MLLSKRPRGQIAPVALFGVLISSAVLTVMFNTGQKITERSQVANAADAAAYSGAVWTARHLNFIAYTNRAMIANHLAVGHFVSYVSWVRYINDSIEAIDRVTQWIPYVGQYVDLVEQISAQVRDATEQAADISIPAMEAWNTNIRAAQAEAQASLAFRNVQSLMDQTGRTYDPHIRINDGDALSRMPEELQALLETQLMTQSAAVPTFIQRYTTSRDSHSMQQLVNASLRGNSDLRRWIAGERGWRENLFAVQLRKRGATPVGVADWRAEDQLQFRTRGVFGWHRWQRIGDRVSSASAREFDSDYSGVPAYYNVSGSPRDASLRIAAIATKSQANVATAQLLGMTATGHPLAVAAIASVEFRRPRGSAFVSLGERRHEYANLFNPFWEAKLAPVTWSF